MRRAVSEVIEKEGIELFNSSFGNGTLGRSRHYTPAGGRFTEHSKSSIPMISVPQLDSWLNKQISEICLNGYAKASDNHCAHFVSHVLSLNFGYTCQRHTGQQHPGANLRVHELFASCPSVQEINSSDVSCKGLVFVSASGNFVTRGGKTTLNNIPKKHIGLLLSGLVWHYSNQQQMVVKQPISQFLLHYPGQQNALWLGSLPAAARPQWSGRC